MKKDTARLLENLDRELARAIRTLHTGLRTRARLDPEGTQKLAQEILEMLVLSAQGPTQN